MKTPITFPMNNLKLTKMMNNLKLTKMKNKNFRFVNFIYSKIDHPKPQNKLKTNNGHS